MKALLSGIQHIGIPTENMTATRQFYKKLGFDIAYETCKMGLNSLNDKIHFLPFWKNGVHFFTIEGPNKEKIEFSQYL